MLFTRITEIVLPAHAQAGAGFDVYLHSDGKIPFAQLIIRQDNGWERIIKDQQIKHEGRYRYRIRVPADAYRAGRAWLQIEGCCQADIAQAGAGDWIKEYRELDIAPRAQPAGRVTLKTSDQPVIYFGIHKHMHQPYYDAVNPDYWDGEKDNIFADRNGAYTTYIPTAVRHYIEGGLAHAGLSSSWSGSLMEQLERCAVTGWGRNVFRGWNNELRQIAQEKTALGNPRLDFTAFGMFHPLMPLIPGRDIVGQIRLHREAVQRIFGVEASDVLFPPETAFAPHMIPALKQAGVNAVIYDSVHHFRACQGYPYAGPSEGLLPPNPADQLNPPVDDWLSLQNVWAPGKISPSLLKPCVLYYTGQAGETHEITGIPAERYLGNEDARGGYGALQYEQVMGQIYDQLVKTKAYDPKHPPFFLLHSDGDNHGGGAHSYYSVNTARLVEMCRHEPRFQLITIKDYLQKFPVDPANRVHLEPGSWAGADNGDAQFSKWFSRAEEAYSPDLNSWAVLTALQNVVHSLEDAGTVSSGALAMLQRLLYTAETSCYWYWTGQDVWDQQVTNAANRALELAGLATGSKDALRQAQSKDATGPTIFLPWVRPANPGGQDWGQGGLRQAAKEATFRTLVYDVSGLEAVTLHCRDAGGNYHWFNMQDLGPYPSRTGAVLTASQFRTVLPAGMGTLRYWVEAVDKRGNHAVSPVQGIQQLSN